MVKTDQIDASTLAHLARMNYIPKAYAASKEMRDLRQLLRHREWMVNQRSRAKNRIHAALAAYCSDRLGLHQKGGSVKSPAEWRHPGKTMQKATTRY